MRLGGKLLRGWTGNSGWNTALVLLLYYVDFIQAAESLRKNRLFSVTNLVDIFHIIN